MVLEPIFFRDDITIKVGGGTAFSIDTMHRMQCVMICGEESTEKSHRRLTDTTTLDAAQGGGREREVVYWVEEMQNVTGSLSQGAHPGSYNGQDAYNDMLVVDDGSLRGERTVRPTEDESDGRCAELYARSANNFEGGRRMEHSVVRRLTPKECERLQGMPDDWSRWGVDENGKVYELSDSARYRLQGNGIATPWWKWLCKRISAQYESTPTMGSLFDGQASFPMIWESINGKGSAVWSSEIDKNAVAVAKYHFPEESEE